MGANSFLVRYAGGWAERKSASSISAYGRQEALLGLGAVSSLAEVNRVADGQLDDFKQPREQTDILIEPRYNSEAPYIGFQVGDTITVAGDDHRVLALSVTEDEATDRVIYVPTLNENLVLNAQERVAQALSKMIRGTVGGRSKVAQPVVPAFIPKGRSAGPSTLSLTVSWLDASSAPVDAGANYADFTYSPSDVTVTGGLANRADRSGVDPVEFTLLTAGAALGPAPYTTEPVTIPVSDELGAFVLFRVEEGNAWSVGLAPSTIDHPDVSLGRDEQIWTNSADPYGFIADYEAVSPGPGVTASFEIGDLSSNTATGCAWVIFALNNCSDFTNTDDFREYAAGERRLRWNTTYTDELLIGAVASIPGSAVHWASPWNANTITVSA